MSLAKIRGEQSINQIKALKILIEIKNKIEFFFQLLKYWILSKLEYNWNICAFIVNKIKIKCKLLIN